MFEHLTESAPKRTHTRSPWTILLSTFLQFVLVGVMILVPLIYTEALPKQQLLTFLVAPPPPPPPPPPPAPAVQRVVKPVRLMEAGKLTAPKAIPKSIEMVKEEELSPEGGAGVVGGVPGGVPGGTPGGVIGGIIGGIASAAPPPPKPEIKRIRVGGQVQAAKIVDMIRPIYPPLAKQARIQGVVRLEAIINKQGLIENLRVISGHPLLIQSALDAVRQWRYQPTLLNGEPVEVVTTIDVVFTLSQ